MNRYSFIVKLLRIVIFIFLRFISLNKDRLDTKVKVRNKLMKKKYIYENKRLTIKVKSYDRIPGITLFIK